MLIHVLWTGGWDSTFRVLQAALTEGHTVQPYYLIDVGRNSTLHELRAMNRIRQAANERGGGERILPIRFHDKDDIEPNAAASASYRALCERMRVGEQYEWLAAFVRQHEMGALELSIEKYPPAFQSELFKTLDTHTSGTGHECRLTVPPDDPALDLFCGFRFPTLHLTKQDMGAQAKAAGFLDLLHMTWFCHNPILEEPCGTCRPCIIVDKTTNRPTAPHPLVMARRMLGQAKRYFFKRLQP